MSTLSFAKYEGAGNDFILIDDRDGSFAADVQKLCHRKFGIGADGVILFQKDFRMRIFNSDGTEAESCGNGLRCLGQFIRDLGIPGEKHQIKIHDRAVEISYVEGKIAVDMGQPRNLKLHLGPVHFVDTGVPHVVYFGEGIEELGPVFRHQFKANANFAVLQPDGSIKVRTFERGVEGETLACGTGACAVAYIASKLYGLQGPIQICFPGGNLEVTIKKTGLVMTGPAKKVFEGLLR